MRLRSRDAVILCADERARGQAEGRAQVLARLPLPWPSRAAAVTTSSTPNTDRIVCGLGNDVVFADPARR